MGGKLRPDVERATELFRRHERDVLAYTLRRAPTVADAEDAAAETFLIALRRAAIVPEHALPWLYGVARRVLANQRRGADRRSRLASMLAREPRDAATPPRVTGTPAIDALTRLRPDDQELLRLVAWEGLRHREIAAVLGISENAVAIRLHRARQRFEREFGRDTDEEKGPGHTRTEREERDGMAVHGSDEEDR